MALNKFFCIDLAHSLHPFRDNVNSKLFNPELLNSNKTHTLTNQTQQTTVLLYILSTRTEKIAIYYVRSSILYNFQKILRILLFLKRRETTVFKVEYLSHDLQSGLKPRLVNIRSFLFIMIKLKLAEITNTTCTISAQVSSCISTCTLFFIIIILFLFFFFMFFFLSFILLLITRSLYGHVQHPSF